MQRPIQAISIGTPPRWAESCLAGCMERGSLGSLESMSLNAYLEAPAKNTHEVIFIFGSQEARRQMSDIRAASKKAYLLWFETDPTQEDLIHAMGEGVSIVTEEARIEEAIGRLKVTLSQAEQFERVARGAKTTLVESGDQIERTVAQTLKTAIGKLERFHWLANRYAGGAPLPSSGETLLLHREQDFADVLLTIAELERSGRLNVVPKDKDSPDAGTVDFLHGTIVGIRAGKVRGRKALHRMFPWKDPSVSFSTGVHETGGRIDFLPDRLETLCLEGNNFKTRLEAIAADVPPAEIELALEPAQLNPGLMLTPAQFDTLSSVIQFGLVRNILDYNPLPDVVILESLIALRRLGLLRIVAS